MGKIKEKFENRETISKLGKTLKISEKFEKAGEN